MTATKQLDAYGITSTELSLRGEEARVRRHLAECPSWYLPAFRGWKTFQPRSDARRWLFAICHNTFLRLRRESRRLVESDEGDLDAMPAVLSHVQAMHDGVGELFEHLDVRPAIERAIGALPEPHHSVLVLVDLEGHLYHDAADILEVPVGTVRSRLFRARRIIQEALLAYAEDAGVGHRLACVDRDDTAVP